MKKKRPSIELREHKRLCGVFDGTFIRNNAASADHVTQKDAKAICDALKVQFDLWWDSWIEPEIKRIEKRKL